MNSRPFGNIRTGVFIILLIEIANIYLFNFKEEEVMLTPQEQLKIIVKGFNNASMKKSYLKN